MHPRLTILVVTWNAWRDLDRLLGSLERIAQDDVEVLVVDNGSTDGTVDKLSERYAGLVRLHQNEANLGLPRAVNQGMELARGETILLLDVDTTVPPETPACLLDFLGQHPEVALVAPRVCRPDGTAEGTARNLPSVSSGLFGRRSVLTRWFPGNPFSRRYLEPERLDGNTPFAVEQVSAACMMFRRELFERAGGWDEAYRCYWVDTDWCARLKHLGLAVWCVPEVTITHYENNRSGIRKSAWRIWHFHTGALRLYRKHYTRGWLDPRTLLAIPLILARATLMFALNQFQPPASQVALQETR